jgi:hypothetical protein
MENTKKEIRDLEHIVKNWDTLDASPLADDISVH